MNSSPVDLSSLRPFKVIKIHDDIVQSLLLLKDGRIAGTSSDKKIILWRNRNDMY